MSTTWIKIGYAILLGIALALTAGFGTAVFVSEPRPPQPLGLTFQTLSGSSTDTENTRIAKQIDSYYDDVNAYREKYPAYQRNIFVVFAAIGLILGVLGVALPALVNYLRLGFLVGGGILLVAGTWFAVHAIPQGTPTASNLLSLLGLGTPKTLDSAGRFLRFAVTIIGVLVLLFVGLWRLTDWPSLAPAKGAAQPSPALAPAAPAATVAMPLAPAPPLAVAPDALKWARPEDRTAADFGAPRPPPPLEAAPPAGIEGGPSSLG